MIARIAAALIATTLGLTCAIAQPPSAQVESEQERLARRLNRELDANEGRKAKEKASLESKDDGLDGMSKEVGRRFRSVMQLDTPEVKRQLEDAERLKRGSAVAREAGAAKSHDEVIAESARRSEEITRRAREAAVMRQAEKATEPKPTK